MKQPKHTHKDFVHHHIDQVNGLYAKLRLPVYGIYKVRNREALKAFEKVICLLEKSTPEELAVFKKIVQQQRKLRRMQG